MSQIKLTTLSKIYIWVVAVTQGVVMFLVLGIIVQSAMLNNWYLEYTLYSLCLGLSVAGAVWCGGAMYQAVIDTVIADRKGFSDPPTPLSEGQIIPIYRRGVRVEGEYMIGWGGRMIRVRQVGEGGNVTGLFDVE